MIPGMSDDYTITLGSRDWFGMKEGMDGLDYVRSFVCNEMI